MDGGLLMPDRFDIGADGSRLGFEDIPSLLGMQVRDKLDERKYHGPCGVDRPQEFVLQAADTMAATLSFIRHDERVPQDLVPKPARPSAIRMPYSFDCQTTNAFARNWRISAAISLAWVSRAK